MKYTMVMAENEEASPWEPLHREFGFSKEDSSVTIAFPQSYIQHYPPSNEEESIMRSVVDYIVPAMTHTIIFPPLHAKTLGNNGWTKQNIKDFICENARMPSSRQRLIIGQGNVRLYKDNKSNQKDELVPIVRDPRTIRVIVAGGPGAFVAHAVGGGPTPGQAEIMKIELPANWDELVKKYRNIVPNYVRY